MDIKDRFLKYVSFWTTSQDGTGGDPEHRQAVCLGG